MRLQLGCIEVLKVSKGNFGRERIEPRDRRQRAKGWVPVRVGTLTSQMKALVLISSKCSWTQVLW